MRFSATKAYENHAIVKFLESIGAPFGACQILANESRLVTVMLVGAMMMNGFVVNVSLVKLAARRRNAYTSFDRTVCLVLASGSAMLRKTWMDLEIFVALSLRYTLHVPTDKEGLVEESLNFNQIGCGCAALRIHTHNSRCLA